MFEKSPWGGKGISHTAPERRVFQAECKVSGQGTLLIYEIRGSQWDCRRKVKVKSLSRVRLFATLWTVAHQAPLPMGFSRQEYWSGLPLPSPGDLPNPGSEPIAPALQADSLPLSHQGNQKSYSKHQIYWWNVENFASEVESEKKMLSQKGEKTTLRMRENNSKWNKWQRISLQNMQAAHVAQYQKRKKKNNPVKK